MQRATGENENYISRPDSDNDDNDAPSSVQPGSVKSDRKKQRRGRERASERVRDTGRWKQGKRARGDEEVREGARKNMSCLPEETEFYVKILMDLHARTSK